MAATGKRGARSADRTLADVVREAPSWPAGLTVLTGGDLYHLDQAQRALIGALADRPVLCICDPMHGNTRTTAGGIKTRSYDDILEGIRSGRVFVTTGDLISELDPLENIAEISLLTRGDEAEA